MFCATSNYALIDEIFYDKVQVMPAAQCLNIVWKELQLEWQ